MIERSSNEIMPAQYWTLVKRFGLHNFLDESRFKSLSN